MSDLYYTLPVYIFLNGGVQLFLLSIVKFFLRYEAKPKPKNAACSYFAAAYL